MNTIFSTVVASVVATQQVMPINCYPLAGFNNLAAENGYDLIILEGSNPVGDVKLFYNQSENIFMIVGYWEKEGAACIVAHGKNASFSNTKVTASDGD